MAHLLVEFNPGLFCPSWGPVCLVWYGMVGYGRHTVPQEGRKGPALNSINANANAKKIHYFSILKNVFKTCFRRPSQDLIELRFLWFFMCFCKNMIHIGVFKTLHGLLSS